MAKFWLGAAIGFYLMQLCLAEIGKCLMNEMPFARLLAEHMADKKLPPACQFPATFQFTDIFLVLK